jgi:hypothetical protein
MAGTGALLLLGVFRGSRLGSLAVRGHLLFVSNFLGRGFLIRERREKGGTGWGGVRVS